MIRSQGFTIAAVLTLSVGASGCGAVSLGHDATGGSGGGSGGTGGREIGGANPGTGGADAGPGGSGGRDSGTGGDRSSTSSSTSSSGSGGAGGGNPVGLCPTKSSGALTSYSQAPYTPAGVVADAAFFYWTGQSSSGGGAVLRTDRSTGVTVEFASTATQPGLPAAAFDYPAGIRLSQGDVVWTAHSGGQILRVPQGGGAATILYASTENTHIPGVGVSPHTFTLDASRLYWNESVRNGDLITNTIRNAPLGGGGPVTTMVTTTVDVNDAMPPPWMPLDLRVLGASVFYTLMSPPAGSGTTQSVDVDGANDTQVSPTGYLADVDATDLYEALESLVIRVARSGGNQALLYQPSQNIAETHQAIVVHGGDVYLTSFGAAFDGASWIDGCGWVKRIPKAGGAAEILWSGKGRPFDVVVEDAGITWSDLDNQTVVHMAL